MNVTIIGLGLIGGSIAKDLHEQGFSTRITGIDASERNASRAKELGLVNELGNIDDLPQDDQLIIIAIPVNHILHILPDVLDRIPSGCIVTDMGSTKEAICACVADHPKRNQFVAAHPIAGTENTGPDAAIFRLFDGKKTILCDTKNSSTHALATVRSLFDCLGMEISEMPAADHDQHMAYVSHLSHITSFTLGLTVLDIEKDERQIFDLAGSGFASTARLAKSSPEMWAPILDQNAAHLVRALDTYMEYLQEFREALDKKDTNASAQLMARANALRPILDGKF